MLSRSRPAVAASSLVPAALLVLGAACRKAAVEGRGVLKQPAAVPETTLLRFDNPFRELAPGVSARTVFASAEPADLTVEVRDLEVGPKRGIAPLRVTGAAILEVRAGRGTFVVGQQPRELVPGAVVAVPADTAFSLRNTGDRTLSLRLYVIAGK